MIHPSNGAGVFTPTRSTRWDSSWPRWVKRSEKDQLLRLLQERFGIPKSVFDNYYFLKRRLTIWLLSKDDRVQDLASLRVESVGLPFLRRVKTHLKPTSAALQIFGRHASKNIVNLDSTQMKELAERKVIKGEFPVSPGYVIVATEGMFIGCALYFPGRLISQFPRHLFTTHTWDYLLGDKGD